MSGRVCIIGAGVVGLSCAVRAKEVLGNASDVTIIADNFGKDTTSDIAAGGFRIESVPKISGYNGKRTDVGRTVAQLSLERYEAAIASTEGAKAGIHRLEGYSIRYPGVVNTHAEVPHYTGLNKNWRKLSDFEVASKFPSLPIGCTGIFLETVMVSPRTYMQWLTQRFIELGGKVKKGTIKSFDELWSEYDIVLNCTGLRADHITGDTTLTPVRGQIIRANITGADNTFVYIHNGTDKPPYYYWTPDGTVLGGTKMVGNANMTPSQEDHDMIMTLAKTTFPWLNVTEDKVIREVVGLRPYRPAIRLETEDVCYNGTKKWIIHNYGHGAHGVSLSWGCAYVAVEMLTEILYPSKL